MEEQNQNYSGNFQQNNPNEKQPHNKSKKGIILLVLFFLIGLAGGYFVYEYLSKDNKTNNDEKEKDNENKDNENIEDNIEKKSIISDAFELTSEKVFSYNTEYNGVKKVLKVKSKMNKDNGNINYREILLDDNSIFTANNSQITSVIPIGDSFLIDTFCLACGGESIEESRETILVGPTGKRSSNLKSIITHDSYIVKGNSIITTTKNHGIILDFVLYMDCYLPNVDTGLVLDKREEPIPELSKPHFINSSNYDKFSNSIVKTEYKINYLGNDRLSEPIKVRDLTLADSYSKNTCDSEYKEYFEKMNSVD